MGALPPPVYGRTQAISSSAGSNSVVSIGNAGAPLDKQAAEDIPVAEAPGTPSGCNISTSWADKVAGFRSNHRGMKLKFVQPVDEDGVPRVSPSIPVLEQGARDWALCLVGHFLDSKLPFPVVKSITTKIWANEGLLDVLPKGKGVYFFRFSLELGCKKILEGGPWLIAGRHLFLRRWEAGMPLSFDVVDKILVWVQLFGVPMEYWTVEGLSCLASAIGLPLYADAATKSCRRISYARICVELNAKQPLIKEFIADTYNSMEGTISGTTKIKVVYQWKPAHCTHCEVFSHSSDNCHISAQANSQQAKQAPSLSDKDQAAITESDTEWRPVHR